MSNTSEHIVDRSGWESGPWDGEPDKLNWIDPETGLQCMIIRQSSCGHLCGYVGVPRNHPYYEVNYEKVDVEVHGGLTYGNKCTGHICHIPEPGQPDDVWWLGFDCAQLGDASPIFKMGTYRDIKYVKAEVTSLANQLG